MVKKDEVLATFNFAQIVFLISEIFIFSSVEYRYKSAYPIVNYSIYK